MNLASEYRAMGRSAVIHFLPLFPNDFSATTATSSDFQQVGINVDFLPIPVYQEEARKIKIYLIVDRVCYQGKLYKVPYQTSYLSKQSVDIY